MNRYIVNFLKLDSNEDKHIRTDKDIPPSPSEEVAREDIDRLNQNIEEIKKIKEEIEKKEKPDKK